MSTIILTREEADVILDHLWGWKHDGDAVPFDTREEASASLADLHRAFDVIDELDGWPGRSSDGRQTTFTATVTPELVRLLQETETEAAQTAERDRSDIERAKAGDRGYWPIDMDNLADVISGYQRQISAEESTARICAEVLSRLVPAEVTA